MTTIINKPFHAERWIYLFICVHLIGWTLAPILIRHNLPLDAIEGTTWGHQLQWGYDKNPYLNGTLTALATYLGGPSGWMIYLFSQISVTAGLWAIWKLANKMLTPVHAMIAVMVLEGVQYFTFHSIDFNDNTLEVGTWALTVYCFYKACRNPSKLAWIFTGFFAGLGMMAKYYTAALLAAMAIFFFLYPENRKQLQTAAPYFGILTFLIIIAPHVYWLFFHDFITIAYVFERASSTPSWTNHLFFPTQFALHQFLTFLPSIILFGILFIGKKPRIAVEPSTLTPFNKTFLYCVGLGPFLLTLLLSILLGTNLRAGWGAPLLSLWGILLVTALQPTITTPKLYRFIATIFIVMGILLSSYSISLLYSKTPTSANFPGREIARNITQYWHDTYHTKLEYVAGSRWVGGNIGFYSDDHPAVFIEWNKQRAPWIDVERLKEKGGVFVWAISDNESMPKRVRKQFPQLQATRVVEYDWDRNINHLPGIKIGIAILPPATTSH